MTSNIVNAQLPAARVRPLLAAAKEVDGVAAFSEEFEQGLDDVRVDHTHLIAEDNDGEAVGAAALAADGSAELVVHPGHRRKGVGTALVNAVRERNPQAGCWAHGDLGPARALAAKLGLEKTRELLVMGVDVDAVPRFEGAPDGYDVVAYSEAVGRYGRELVDKQLLDVNNDAFSWHPEQGGWDLARLQRAMEAEWFDADGVQLLYRGEDLAGFHWTKRHPDGTGEVYVVGLASKYRGEGLGVPLLLAGLEFLRETGSAQVILYVESDNEAAVGLYERLGFEVRERHAVYA
ncbi:mycothiol synthase [Corynebacterium sp. BCW_4722]|nr:mycothiol synthase [Corynebacterium sp. BCW_4722]